jgi:predicted nuclease of restriction endonuclease-like (RecB) superfamily
MPKKPHTSIIHKPKVSNAILTAPLLNDLRLLIDQTRQQVAQTANAALVLMNWHIGKRISDEILKNQRAEYGKEIVASLSRQLTAEYGKGFTRTNLIRMRLFAEFFPNIEISATLSHQLSWSHFVEVLSLKDHLKRDFYVEMCRIERWSVRTLRERINGMLYERTALSKKPEELIKQEIAALREKDKLSPDLIFRDPYFLEFLNLADTYSEKDLENAILRELERFLLEVGSDFAFVARQKRITVDGDDFYIDLLFYHRRLRRLVAIELKLGKFMPADFGQLEFYLRWLDKYERQASEESPIGLILCSEKSTERVEILALEKHGIRVAEYLTELPDKKLLEQKLHEAIQSARKQFASTEIVKKKKAR